MVKKKIQMLNALVLCTVTILSISECLGSDTTISLDALAQRVAQLEHRINQMKLRRERLGEVIEGINFAVNSDKLNAESKLVIDQLIKKIHDIRNTYFYVAGYTDSKGSAEYNYQLGLRRASNVARYLIESEHIDPSHVTTGSHGKADPFTTDNDKLGLSLNRHVEILAYRWVIR